MTSLTLNQHPTWRCQIGDRLSEVDKTVEQADAFAAQAGLDEDRRYALQVCVEEALANLIMHGRPGPEGKQIALELRAAPGAPFIISVSDSCQPFDVVNAVVRVGGQNQEPGGRGIALQRAFSKRMRYWSEGGRNFLDIEI